MPLSMTFILFYFTWVHLAWESYAEKEFIPFLPGFNPDSDDDDRNSVVSPGPPPADRQNPYDDSGTHGQSFFPIVSVMDPDTDHRNIMVQPTPEPAPEPEWRSYDPYYEDYYHYGVNDYGSDRHEIEGSFTATLREQATKEEKVVQKSTVSIPQTPPEIIHIKEVEDTPSEEVEDTPSVLKGGDVPSVLTGPQQPQPITGGETNVAVPVGGSGGTPVLPSGVLVEPQSPNSAGETTNQVDVVEGEKRWDIPAVVPSDSDESSGSRWSIPGMGTPGERPVKKSKPTKSKTGRSFSAGYFQPTTPTETGTQIQRWNEPPKSEPQKSEPQENEPGLVIEPPEKTRKTQETSSTGVFTPTVKILLAVATACILGFCFCLFLLNRNAPSYDKVSEAPQPSGAGPQIALDILDSDSACVEHLLKVESTVLSPPTHGSTRNLEGYPQEPTHLFAVKATRSLPSLELHEKTEKMKSSDWSRVEKEPMKLSRPRNLTRHWSLEKIKLGGAFRRLTGIRSEHHRSTSALKDLGSPSEPLLAEARERDKFEFDNKLHHLMTPPKVPVLSAAESDDELNFGGNL